MQNSKILYIDSPCERCGSPKLVSKSRIEEIKTARGISTIEVSQVTCKNKNCQAEFDKKRKVEIEISNNRKIEKEKQLQIRKENMANNIAQRNMLKKLLKPDVLNPKRSTKKHQSILKKHI